MPEPVRNDHRYLPGIDGLRALAVAAVIAYHLGFGWAQGGLLGVGVFFTLSGFLITRILLGQQEKDGALRLREFWVRRARRLLPAVFVMLAVTAVWVCAAARTHLPGLRGDIIASALYVSNWWYIGQHASYYAQFSPPAPLDHLWSLAVEEQFYLLWPWLLLAGLWLLHRRRGARAAAGGLAPPGRPRSGRRVLAAVIAGLAAASAIEMAVLYHPGYDPTRVYEGTDTRAFALLAGAALAAAWPDRQARPSRAGAAAIDLAGAAGLAGIAILIWRTTAYTPFTFRGGLVLASLATAAVLAAASAPGTVTGRALGWRPLRWLGVRSYGIYLWHYPLIVLTAPPLGAAFGLPRAAAVVAATIVIATVSWALVEEPVRRGHRPRLPRLPRPAVPVAAAGTILAVAGVMVTLRWPAPQNTAATTARQEAGGQTRLPAAGAGSRPAVPGTRPAAPSGPVIPGRTSCRSVVHIGDSTSEGLTSPAYLPDPAQRITARYAAAGATRQDMQISGGRSIVEALPGQQNADTVARAIIATGYHGCWVLALGTDDTADVAAGSGTSLAQRVRRMMADIGPQPVLWVNVKTLVPAGPYSEQNMTRWNRTIARLRPRYPHMRIYDWASAVRNSWFISDGIHYTSTGYQHRARMIADALAAAFPARRGQHARTATRPGAARRTRASGRRLQAAGAATAPAEASRVNRLGRLRVFWPGFRLPISRAPRAVQFRAEDGNSLVKDEQYCA